MHNVKKDHQIVADALTNGPGAFEPIVERYRRTVFSIAFARLGNVHDAEDITQEVFTEAFMRLDRLRDPARLGAWLRAITIHHCIDLLRRPQSKLAFNHDTPDVPSDLPSPPETILRRERRERVMAAIAALPGKQREALTLFYIKEYSIRDIAAMLDAPIGSVKRRLHDGRLRLKTGIL